VQDRNAERKASKFSSQLKISVIVCTAFCTAFIWYQYYKYLPAKRERRVRSFFADTDRWARGHRKLPIKPKQLASVIEKKKFMTRRIRSSSHPPSAPFPCGSSGRPSPNVGSQCPRTSRDHPQQVRNSDPASDPTAREWGSSPEREACDPK